MTARYLLTRVQSGTTKINFPKKTRVFKCDRGLNETLAISHLLRFILGMVQNRRTCATFPGIISSVVAIIKAGNRVICCRQRIFILFSIANLRMRLLRLFRCSSKSMKGVVELRRSNKKKSFILEFVRDFCRRILPF